MIDALAAADEVRLGHQVEVGEEPGVVVVVRVALVEVVVPVARVDTSAFGPGGAEELAPRA